MADPIAQADIQDSLAATLGAVDDAGLVLTDSKWSRNETELYDLLRGQGTGRAKGSVLEWKEVVNYEVAGDTTVNVTYRYRWRVFRPYQNDGDDGKTSLKAFSEYVDACILALTANRILDGLRGNAEVVSIATRQEFAVADWVGSTKPESSHMGDFNIDTKVLQPC